MRATTHPRSHAHLTAFASLVHFDFCFTIWVLLGALGIFISRDLGFNNVEKGLVVAIPTLSGSIMRILVGFLADRIGGKSTGVGLLLFLYLPLVFGWLVPLNLPLIIILGILLGVAGSSFAVALPLTSRWYPPEKQGLVMGITAAGNMGTVLSNLVAPSLALRFGWQSIFGFAMLPLTLVLIIFMTLARTRPEPITTQPLAAYFRIFKQVDLWWFTLFYAVTFGGFVGMGTFMPIFLNTQYAIDPVQAGSWTALAALLGSVFRPLGGFLADKLGGTRMLIGIFSILGLLYICTSLLFPFPLMIWTMDILMIFLGLGNGSIFQVIPQRFHKEIGIVTGIVGAAGGIGGFLLPILLGIFKQVTGSFMFGLLLLAGIALLALIILTLLLISQSRWQIFWSNHNYSKEILHG